VKPPTEHPVTAYARAVDAGAIVAGRMVRLACRRHLEDLVRLKPQGSTFNEAYADHALKFFPTYLRLVDGRVRCGGDRATARAGRRSAASRP
jgi:hypothetical protein